MTNELIKLQSSIEKTIELIDKSNLDVIKAQAEKANKNFGDMEIDFSETKSLLEQCESVEKQYGESKPAINVIHHFACTGGTLLSKCISALPNVFLLSEVHPLARKHLGNGAPKFTPSDIISCLHYANVPGESEIAKDIFFESIKLSYHYIKARGGNLVIREHSHTDYCVGEWPLDSNAVVESLNKYFYIKSLLLLRNPVDSYASLVNNGWEQYSPKGFDEYCSRLNLMTQNLSNAKVVFYEEFVENPTSCILDICKYFDLSYNENFIDVFEISKVSGDSGRKSSVIATRKRREISDTVIDEIAHSEQYQKFLKSYPRYNENYSEK